MSEDTNIINNTHAYIYQPDMSDTLGNKQLLVRKIDEGERQNATNHMTVSYKSATNT